MRSSLPSGRSRDHSADRARGIAHQRRDARLRQQRDLGPFGGLAQAVDQFRAAAARQAVHAAVAVAGIVEIMHHAERQRHSVSASHSIAGPTLRATRAAPAPDRHDHAPFAGCRQRRSRHHRRCRVRAGSACRQPGSARPTGWCEPRGTGSRSITSGSTPAAWQDSAGDQSRGAGADDGDRHLRVEGGRGLGDDARRSSRASRVPRRRC